MANESGDWFSDESSISRTPEGASEVEPVHGKEQKGKWYRRGHKVSPSVPGYTSQSPAKENDPWLDDRYGTLSLDDDYTSKARDPKPHRRRFSRKARLVIAGTTAAALVAGGVGLKVFTGGGESHVRTSISAPRTSEAQIDPDLASLQKDYADSHAEFQTDGQPFAFGLTPAEQVKYKELYNELFKSTTTPPSTAFTEYEALDQKIREASQETNFVQKFIEKYDARFIGKVALSTGQKVNFYIVNNHSGEKVTIDAKAFDAYVRWGIDQLDNVYQRDGGADDAVRLAKIAKYQQAAKAGELNYTVNFMINPTPDNCFNKNDDIIPGSVKYKNGSISNPRCYADGFNSTQTLVDGSVGASVIGLNSVSDLNTSQTYNDPNLKRPIVWVKDKLATNIAGFHEFIGHGPAFEAGLFPGGEVDPPNGFSADHLQFTDPQTNRFIRFLSRFRPNELPPLPITIQKGIGQ